MWHVNIKKVWQIHKRKKNIKGFLIFLTKEKKSFIFLSLLILIWIWLNDRMIAHEHNNLVLKIVKYISFYRASFKQGNKLSNELRMILLKIRMIYIYCE